VVQTYDNLMQLGPVYMRDVGKVKISDAQMLQG